MYGVPEALECRVPLPGESVRDVNDWEVAFYSYLFRLGVRIPLHPFCYRFLTFFGLCPTQLTLNGWVVLLGIVVLSHLSGLPMDMRTLRSFLSLKYKSDSDYYTASDPNYQVISDPPSAHKKWKESFFFIRGPIGDVPYQFGAPCKNHCFACLFNFCNVFMD